MEPVLDLVPVAMPKAPKMRKDVIKEKSLEEELEDIMSEHSTSVLHDAWLSHFKEVRRRFLDTALSFMKVFPFLCGLVAVAGIVTVLARPEIIVH
eukprot:3501637-Karenia_brevis.AAC.1